MDFIEAPSVYVEMYLRFFLPGKVTAIRIEFFGDEIERISEIDVLTGEIKSRLSYLSVFPASHYVVPQEQIMRATKTMEAELTERVKYFKSEGKLLEAQRISERTNFDIEMLRETGFCSGIENYSRHMNGTAEGALQYIVNFIRMIIYHVDESHMTIRRLGELHAGDRSRRACL